MKSTSRTCPFCGTDALVETTYSDSFAHNGVALVVEGLECSHCESCGEQPVLKDQIRRNQVRVCDARRSHDGLLTSAEIKSLRDRFKLSQSDAAAVFGGGENAFSKYERGEIIQSVSMDRLLRTASAVPGVAPYLRRCAGLVETPTAAAVGYVASAVISWLDDPNYTSRPLGENAKRVTLANYRDDQFTNVTFLRRAAG